MINSIDFKSLKPFKKEVKMVDPHRFPKVLIPLEEDMKKSYDSMLGNMALDITKLLVKFVK